VSRIASFIKLGWYSYRLFYHHPQYLLTLDLDPPDDHAFRIFILNAVAKPSQSISPSASKTKTALPSTKGRGERGAYLDDA
jgi:hypothetical protein